MCSSHTVYLKVTNVAVGARFAADGARYGSPGAVGPGEHAQIEYKPRKEKKETGFNMLDVLVTEIEEPFQEKGGGATNES